jgi:superfamily II DNA/RNA helicase
MNESFINLGIGASLTAALDKAGLTTPTAIQSEVVPVALAGRDVVAQSATGTGKTLAYLLPLFAKLDITKRENQAIILAPTHELAIQIQRQIEVLAQNAEVAVTSAPLIGNANITRQIDKLKERPHIVVGSSGRILELIQKKKITAQTVKTIILDEADRLLDEHNNEAVKAVIKTTLKDRQVMLFSATITPQTLERSSLFLNDPAIITVKQQATGVADGINHMYFVCEQRDKVEVLRKLVHSTKLKKALVFINRSEDLELTADKLNYHGLKAAPIHGTFLQADRKKSLEDFRNGKVQLLVASDLAARGLDIPGVEYVFNMDLPEDPAVYLHRVGRTGRAGQAGSAISIISQREFDLIQHYEKVLKITIRAKQIAHGRITDLRKA